VARVNSAPASLPPDGSVRQKEASWYEAQNGVRNRFFCSSVPPSRIGSRARQLAMIEVVIPAQP
jgi:hypothetical protein